MGYIWNMSFDVIEDEQYNGNNIWKTRLQSDLRMSITGLFMSTKQDRNKLQTIDYKV